MLNCLYYIHRTATQLGYASTTSNLQIFLNTQKNPFLNQATHIRSTCQKNTLKKNFQPKKSFDHPITEYATWAMLQVKSMFRLIFF